MRSLAFRITMPFVFFHITELNLFGYWLDRGNLLQFESAIAYNQSEQMYRGMSKRKIKQ